MGVVVLVAAVAVVVVRVAVAYYAPLQDRCAQDLVVVVLVVAIVVALASAVAAATPAGGQESWFCVCAAWECPLGARAG